MDFERQKPVSDEYRENWERIYTRRSFILNENGLYFTREPLRPLTLYDLSKPKEANG